MNWLVEGDFLLVDNSKSSAKAIQRFNHMLIMIANMDSNVFFIVSIEII